MPRALASVRPLGAGAANGQPGEFLTDMVWLVRKAVEDDFLKGGSHFKERFIFFNLKEC